MELKTNPLNEMFRTGVPPLAAASLFVQGDTGELVSVNSICLNYVTPEGNCFARDEC